jgi:hypothetical protein
MKIQISLAACAALAAFGANAADYVESAIETTTAVVHLPTAIPQTVAVRACAECDATNLVATADTHYFIGHTEVTLEELRQSMATVNTWAYVFYDAKQKVITRIKLDAVVNPSLEIEAKRNQKRRGN